MGCSSFKLPSFPPPSVAEGIAPKSPPDEFNSQLIKFIPKQGEFRNAIAVYLPNDVGAPSHFFMISGQSYQLFKITMNGNEQVATIKSGVVESKLESPHTTLRGGKKHVTHNAKLALTVITKIPMEWNIK